MMYCSVNGIKTSQIAINDRGLAYGDGFFTTAKINHHKVEMLSMHLERLKSSAEVLKINNVDFDAITKELNTIATHYLLAVVKVVITAGIGGRGYSRFGADKPCVIITVSEYPSHYERWQKTGISVDFCHLELGLNPMLAGIKHLNRLEQVLIKQELDNKTVDDLVICDINGFIVESSCANIFWIKAGQFFTCDLTNSGVIGLVRKKLLQLLPDVTKEQITKTELLQADAVFITNALMGVVPVNMIAGHHFAIEEVLAVQQLFLKSL